MERTKVLELSLPEREKYALLEDRRAALVAELNSMTADILKTRGVSSAEVESVALDSEAGALRYVLKQPPTEGT